MTASRSHRSQALLAAALLLGALTLAACGGHSPTVSSRVSAAVPQRVAAPPASTAPTASAAAAPSGGAAETADVEQDLAGISNQLAAAGQDLQDGPTEQTIDPRG